MNDPQLRIAEYVHCGMAAGARACPVDASSYCDPLVALPSSAVDLNGTTTYAEEWAGMNVTAQCVTLDEAGYTNYNTFGYAVLITLQLFTLDAWESIYNGILESAGWVSVFYFAIVVFVGGFFVLNLVLAVVTNAFDDTKDDVEEEEADIEAEYLNKFGKNKKKRRVAIEAHVSPGSKHVQKLVESTVFVHFITLLIILNTVVMACWYPRMTQQQDLTISVLNYIFGAFFALEAILKLIAYGPKDYFFYHPIEMIDPEARSSANWNRFDFFIVLASITEIVLLYGFSNSSSRGLSVLRVFRAVRLAKLVENWRSMQKLVETIGRSLQNIGNLMLILIIVVYTFAALGMQTFRGDYFAALNVSTYADALHIQKTDPAMYHEIVPRWNFIDFAHSFMMVFRVLCGEWIEPVLQSWEFSNKVLSFIFFIVALIIGNFIILNLFIALLLGAFDDVEEEEEKQHRVMAASLKLWSGSKPPAENDAGRAGGVKTGLWGGTGVTTVRKLAEMTIRPEDADKLINNHLLAITPLCCCIPSLETKMLTFRNKVTKFATSAMFESFVLLAILSSTVMLAFDDHPNRDNAKLHKALDTGNFVFAVLFTLEMCIKVFGFGWSGYFKNGWNFVDFLLVVVGIVGLVMTATAGSAGAGTASMRTLRSLRALRPLRAIRRWESMKVVVDALISSIPAIFNVVVFTFLVFLIFAIFGVQFFGGKFGSCQVTATGELYNYTLIAESTAYHNLTTHKEACNSTFIEGFGDGEVLWVDPSVSFDSTLQAFVALFQLATFEGWVDVLQAGQDATGIDMQPKAENQYYASVFFVVFIFFGSFFTLNLFIGVIIDNFQDRKRMLENLGKNGGMFLTPSQRRFLNILRKGLAKTPNVLVLDPEESPIRHFCYKLANARAFEIVIGACILINSVFFTISHYGQSETMDVVQWVANTIFVAIFMVEAIIKMVGFGPRGYFREAWNCFDFAIVVSSAIGLIVDMSTGPSVAEWADTSGSGSQASMLRLFRIVRLFRFLRFLKYAKNLRRLLTTLLMSLPSLLNIFTLFVMMITIFALVGMSLFKDVMHNGDLNDYVNFETFGSSILLLFRLATAAGMDGLMASCSVEVGCDPNFYGEDETNCGQPGTAKVYFISLVIIVFMIVINTYVAIILENMDELATEESLPDSIPPDALSDFYRLWSKYDPRGTHFLTYAKLRLFLNDLPAPLGFKGKDTNCTLHDLRELRIPLYAGDAVEQKPKFKAMVKKRISGKFFSAASKNKVGPNASDGLAVSNPKRASTKSRSKVVPVTSESKELEAKSHCVSMLSTLIEAAMHFGKERHVDPGKINSLTDQHAASRYKRFRENTKPITNTFHYDPKDGDDMSVIELDDTALEEGSPLNNTSALHVSRDHHYFGADSMDMSAGLGASPITAHSPTPATTVFAAGLAAAKGETDALSAGVSSPSNDTSVLHTSRDDHYFGATSMDMSADQGASPITTLSTKEESSAAVILM